MFVLSTELTTTMQKHSVATCLLLLTVLLLAELAAATYRKPPFNGSIFGKRGNVVGKYSICLNNILCYENRIAPTRENVDIFKKNGQ